MRASTLALGAAAALGFGAAPAHAASIRECGHLDRGAGVKNLTTRNVSCSDARLAARTWERGRLGSHVDVVERRLSKYVTDVRMTRSGGRYVVRFQYVTD